MCWLLAGETPTPGRRSRATSALAGLRHHSGCSPRLSPPACSCPAQSQRANANLISHPLRRYSRRVALASLGPRHYMPPSRVMVRARSGWMGASPPRAPRAPCPSEPPSLGPAHVVPCMPPSCVMVLSARSGWMGASTPHSKVLSIWATRQYTKNCVAIYPRPHHRPPADAAAIR